MAEAEGDLSFYCSEAFRDENPSAYRVFARRAPSQVARLIRIHRKDPEAVYRASSESERTMRRVLEIAVNNLRACDSQLAKTIENEL